MTVTILNGDCRDILKTLPSESFDCCVTSPPYWGLRDYGVDGQIGLEQTLDQYLDTMVDVFREVKRVLKKEGTFWLNIGDSYYNYRPGKGQTIVKQSLSKTNQDLPQECARRGNKQDGLKEKDLCMVPNRLAIRLQEDGWYVRSEIIWHKSNPMPESVKDRPTCSHEKVWLLTKSSKYFYDADSIREEPSESLLRQIKEGYTGTAIKDYASVNVQDPSDTKKRIIENARKKMESGLPFGANSKNVWTITTKSFKGSHFAVMPYDLAERCIKAGCPLNGTVIDPFGGAGTTGLVATNLNRNATLIELNPQYVNLSNDRIDKNQTSSLEEFFI